MGTLLCPCPVPHAPTSPLRQGPAPASGQAVLAVFAGCCLARAPRAVCVCARLSWVGSDPSCLLSPPPCLAPGQPGPVRAGEGCQEEATGSEWCWGQEGGFWGGPGGCSPHTQPRRWPDPAAPCARSSATASSRSWPWTCTTRWTAGRTTRVGLAPGSPGLRVCKLGAKAHRDGPLALLQLSGAGAGLPGPPHATAWSTRAPAALGSVPYGPIAVGAGAAGWCPGAAARLPVPVPVPCRRRRRSWGQARRPRGPPAAAAQAPPSFLRSGWSRGRAPGWGRGPSQLRGPGKLRAPTAGRRRRWVRAPGGRSPSPCRARLRCCRARRGLGHSRSPPGSCCPPVFSSPPVQGGAGPAASSSPHAHGCGCPQCWVPGSVPWGGRRVQDGPELAGDRHIPPPGYGAMPGPWRRRERRCRARARGKAGQGGVALTGLLARCPGRLGLAGPAPPELLFAPGWRRARRGAPGTAAELGPAGLVSEAGMGVARGRQWH